MLGSLYLLRACQAKPRKNLGRGGEGRDLRKGSIRGVGTVGGYVGGGRGPQTLDPGPYICIYIHIYTYIHIYIYIYI